MSSLVYGVGLFGEGKYLSRDPFTKKTNKEYTMWTNMLARCYSEVYRSNPNNPKGYESCTVCEDWHNFQTFATWCNEQPNFGKLRYSLDKDLTLLGNTVYCPEYCYIVAPAINSCIKTISWRCNNTLPAGVYVNQGKYVVSFKGKLGRFCCPEEAGRFYCNIKTSYLRSLAGEYKDEISEAIYNNILNFKPSILPSSNP